MFDVVDMLACWHHIDSQDNQCSFISTPACCACMAGRCPTSFSQSHAVLLQAAAAKQAAACAANAREQQGYVAKRASLESDIAQVGTNVNMLPRSCIDICAGRTFCKAASSTAYTKWGIAASVLC